MKLEDASSRHVNELSRESVVVLPLASIEQHGPHLPVGTDSFIAEGIATALDEAFGGSLLILPVQKIGCSDHHMSFAGTLTIHQETFMTVVLEALGAITSHGFHHILLLNAHGGNQAIGEVIAQKAAEAWPEVDVVFATWWRTCTGQLKTLVDGEFRDVGHACEFETSLMLALRPELVDMTLADDGGRPTTPLQLRSEMLGARWGATFSIPFNRLTEHGVYGQATLATREKGGQILDCTVAAFRDLITSFWPTFCSPNEVE